MCEPHRYNTVVNTWTILNLNRIKFRLDLLLRDVKARKEYVRTLRLILVQSAKWNTKAVLMAFDSLNRDSLKASETLWRPGQNCQHYYNP